MKKGFTLVELLAVIAILAILVIIALPNVMGMFNTAKENSFNTEVKEVFKTAQQAWISDNMFNSGEKVYSRCKSGCTNALDLSGRSELEYYIKLNQSGEVVEYYATDGTFQYGYNGPAGLKIENITQGQKLSEINDTEKITISSSKPYIGGNEVIAPKALTFRGSFGNTQLYYLPGMTWREWLDSSYNASLGFKIENRSAQTRYNDNVTDKYLENNAEGISTSSQAYNCSYGHYLTSFELLYNETLKKIVSPDDEISNEYNYSVMGNMC